MTTLIDGNTDIIGELIDNILSFVANLFGGLATFGTTMGIILGVVLVLGLILVLIGKIKVSKIIGNIKP